MRKVGSVAIDGGGTQGGAGKQGEGGKNALQLGLQALQLVAEQKFQAQGREE